MADRRIRRTLVTLGMSFVLAAAFAMPAHAAFSAGVGEHCDADNHCVAGGAFAINGGPSGIVDVQVVPDETGAATAVCWGSSNGATLLEIECHHGRVENTMSFPGPSGAVPLVTTQARLERLPVCWQVTGYFPLILGSQHIVGTSGCAQLSV